MVSSGNVNIFFVDIASLSDYDLLEYLTINNTSHVVKAESRGGLVNATTKLAATEDGTQRKGLPYLVYRHDRPALSEGPAFRVVPVKTKYFSNISKVMKVYNKQELLGRIEHIRVAIINGEAARDGMIDLQTIHEAWPDLSEQLQVYLFKLANKEYAQRIELNIEKFNEKVRRDHAFLENEITELEIVEGISTQRLPLASELERYKLAMRNSQLNFLNRTKATAASSAPSESEKSVIQTRPNPVDHATAQSSARSMSWEDEFDERDYPEPQRLRIQEDDLLLEPQTNNRQTESTPRPRQPLHSSTLDATPVIERVQEEEIVNVTQHRQTNKEKDHVKIFIEEEIQTDGIKTPPIPARDFGPIGSGREEGDLINLSLEEANQRERTEQRVGFAGEQSPAHREAAQPEPARRGNAQARQRSPYRSAMRKESRERGESTERNQRSNSRTRNRSRERLRTMRDDRGYEFGAKQINYSIYDDKDQDQTPLEFFRNFRIEVSTNLKRGDIFDVPVQIIEQLAKSCIKSKEKKKAFERECRMKEPRRIGDVENCFVEAMTISNQLRKTRFNAIKKKPVGENWVDFAGRFEKQFEVAYGLNSEGGANLVLMERFQRTLTTQREMETLQMYLLMVDEKDQNIHSLAEKLEIVEANVISKEAEKHPLYVLNSKEKTKQTECRFCGRKGHIEKECRKKMASMNKYKIENKENCDGCQNCGRSNHETHECFAKSHINDQNGQRRNNNQYNSSNNRDNNRRYGYERRPFGINSSPSTFSNNNSRGNGQSENNYNSNRGFNGNRNNYNNNRSNGGSNGRQNNQNVNNQRNQSRNNQYDNNRNWQRNNNANNGYNNRGGNNNSSSRRQDTQYQHNRFKRQ